jgi:FkbM family methyltransferase
MIRPLKRFIKEQFPKTTLRVKTRRKIEQGQTPDLSFLADLRQQVSALPPLRHLARRWPADAAAIDVGANIGEYAWALAQHMRRVIAIEPVPELAALLRRGAPGNVEVVEGVMGATAGEVQLRVPNVNGRRAGALATVADHDFKFSDIENFDTITVKQFTVDDLARTRNVKPFVVKIDVEGYEMHVLRGATQVIHAHRPLLLIEIERRHNDGFAEVFTWLASQGYEAYDFRALTPRPSGPSVVDESFNYLIANGIHGMTEMVNRLTPDKYVSNFLFVPVT